MIRLSDPALPAQLEDVVKGRQNGHRPAYEVKFENNKLVLPPAPDVGDPAGGCAWLTAVFNLDSAHPIVGGALQGLRGPEGHVVLRRLDAPPLRFEPVSRLNVPAKLDESLAWQTLPSDGQVYGFRTEHCKQIAPVVRRLCAVADSLTHEQETAGIVGAFLQSAQRLEGLTTYGSGGARYEAATALQRDLDEVTGRPIGPPRYLVDRNTGELAIRIVDLSAVARQYVGGSLPRGWLDARMEDLAGGGCGSTVTRCPAGAAAGAARDGRRLPRTPHRPARRRGGDHVTTVFLREYARAERTLATCVGSVESRGHAVTGGAW